MAVAVTACVFFMVAIILLTLRSLVKRNERARTCFEREKERWCGGSLWRHPQMMAADDELREGMYEVVAGAGTLEEG